MVIKENNIKTLIIGAGLSGLYAASQLAAAGRPFLILEARDLPGGRIQRQEFKGLSVDLGPSWYWPAIHPFTANLISDLKIGGFRQFEEGYARYQRPDGRVQTVHGFANEPHSWRPYGGPSALIDKLLEQLPEGCLRCNHPVCGLKKLDCGVRITVGELEREPRASFTADRVILALPPRLAASTILFEPELPDQLTQAMLKIGTWMAGQAKFFAFYDQPFWRRQGLSGQAFSQRGPLGEVHDASAAGAHGPFGLFGFLGLPATQRRQITNLDKTVIAQLCDLFGPEATQPLAIFYRDWAREIFTATTLDQPPMYQHPVYRPPAGRTSFWEERVVFAGSETAHKNGGYIDGALRAGQRAASEIYNNG